MDNQEKVEKSFYKLVSERPTFYVLDTETTGLGLDDEIVEISVIDQDGNTIIDTLVKPSIPIPKGASEIHGIYDNHVETAPTWESIYPELRSALRGQRVFIYNAEFDVKMIKRANKKYGLEEGLGAHGRCVMMPFAEWNGDWNEYRENYRWVRLENAAKLLELDTSKVRLHRAIGDCQLTLGVVKEMARRGEMRN